MEIVPVYARALTDEHLPMIDGHVAEVLSAARMGEQMALRWVPAGADLNVEPEIAEYSLDELVPVLRRSEWREATRMSNARTQDDILARIETVKSEDWLGFKLEVLVPHLDYEHARPYLKPEVAAYEWQPRTEAELQRDAFEYYEFALTKIEGHRGISANRSVEKLTEYAWLMGRDDIVAAMDAAPFEQYGAPKVRAFADALSLGWPVGVLERMASGLPCEPGCEAGCG